MLAYLDNYVSTNAGPNENYARELLELHTLGAMHYQQAGGYTDDDVYETSRCFTGWSVEFDKESEQRGQFKYMDERHDRFQKIVLGTAIPRDQDPLRDGDMVLERLARHPATAKHLAQKLCVRFVSDAPSSELIASTASVFLEHHAATDQIKLCLAHIFESEEFKQSMGKKFKRPLDWSVSWMRAIGANYNPTGEFHYGWVLQQMGQPPFRWRTPDGPPDTADYWSTSNGFYWRWRIASESGAGWHHERSYHYGERFAKAPQGATPREMASFAADSVLHHTPSSSTFENLVEFAAEGRNPDLPLNQEAADKKMPFLVALCTMTPEFMRR
jgi:uncharacterized protein (DUF1800 family)